MSGVRIMQHILFYSRIMFTSGTFLICSPALSFKLGLENINPNIIKKYNLTAVPVGLITNQTGRNQVGTSTLEVLCAKGINITSIFVPEHGYTGTVPAGQSVENCIETGTHIPIVSLYSHQDGLVGRTINQEKISTVAVLIFDMQDSGMRHYTYISTLMRCLEAAATYKKLLFVLDRPNPLGANMDGPLVEDDLLSFISIASIPLRHGMTIGELALYFNQYILTKKADLHVIPMKEYTRHCNRPLLAALSPNLLTTQACYGYSFLGLLGEIKPFDVGVGTDYAFQCIMVPRSASLPHTVWESVQKLLARHGIKSSRYTVFSARKKEDLEGVRIHIPNINTVHSFNLLLNLVALFRKQAIELSFAPTFDKAIGTHAIRTALCNDASTTELYDTYKHELTRFHAKARTTFLYSPHPHIVH
jgi:uncharacterized protein YbbC (DUF1343 family)